RWLDAVCMIFPYAYGSQRRGHPNLARGLGVHNLNEAAGGYAGLATLVWLAPLAIGRRGRRNEAGFLATLGLLGAAGALRLPPVDNLLRALPVLEVTDNRRLALWVAFSLSLMGGFGLDALARGSRVPRGWIACWLLAAVVMGGIAAATPRLEPFLRASAERHYRKQAQERDEPPAGQFEARARRHVQAALAFIPRYYGLVATELILLASLATVARRSELFATRLPGLLLPLTLLDLFGFGMGLNPAIPAGLHHFEPPVIARLRARLEPGERALGCGQELSPNVLSRFALDDPRNYDSVELARSLRWFQPLFEPSGEPLSSRRRITWAGVLRARKCLEESCVAAVIAATAPPADSFPMVERVGRVFIAWLNPSALAENQKGGMLKTVRREPGRITLRSRTAEADLVVIRETYDPGWRAWIDGAPAPLSAAKETFLAVAVPPGNHLIELEYEPPEMFYALLASALGGLGTIVALTDPTRFWIPGITNTGLGRIQAPRLESSCDLTRHLGPAH
ncbi:MAG: YfhO family protein, partial [Planctomycetaceae bacterium]|nr:YfhO family protein [Planctomycetaceae bacterium]